MIFSNRFYWQKRVENTDQIANEKNLNFESLIYDLSFIFRLIED